MKRTLKKMSIVLLALVVVLALSAWIVLHRPQFGGAPEGMRLEAVRRSSHFVDGAFRNLVTTPKFTQDVNVFSVLRDDVLNRKGRLVPDAPVPSVKTDLKGLDPERDVVVWLGHSSFFIQVGGRRILLDPILSSFAAPLPFLNRAFAGTSIYDAGDMPDIDALLISHDHWDHLDHATAVALREKVDRVVCPLGVGTYFDRWGYRYDTISEADWYEAVSLGEGLTVHVLPARHYSGRSLRQNGTLWAGFALESADRRLFFSGDSGYGPHFAEIGRGFGGFDLVALDCGQYDDRWAAIHMTPEEAALAARDLGAKMFLPSHMGRFTIARHEWDEPFLRAAAASDGAEFRLTTPMIGQTVHIDDDGQRFTHWWRAAKPFDGGAHAYLGARATAVRDHAATGDDGVAAPTREGTAIRFRFSEQEIVVAMVDNSAARSLRNMLPLTLRFEDYARTEKVGTLPKKLDTSDVPAGYDPSVGDLTLYAPWGNLAFFYEDHGYARGLVPLGRVVSGSHLLEELDRADLVRIEIAE